MGFEHFELFCNHARDDDQMQNVEAKIYRRLWKSMGQITRESHPDLSHVGFGRAAFHNLEGCRAPNAIKAYALDSFFSHVIKEKLKQIALKFQCGCDESAFSDFANLFNLSSEIPLLNEIQNLVYHKMWERMGKPTEKSDDPVLQKIAHPDFGKVTFHHLEGRFCSEQEKADAISSCICEMDSRKFSTRLYERADNYFRRNSTNLNPIDTSSLYLPPGNRAFTIHQLLQQFQGVCFGDTHSDCFSINFFQAYMDLFKEIGVKTLFMELFYNETQSDLDAFNRGGELTPELYARCLDVDTKISPAARYNTLTVILAARKLGIRVVGIDTKSTCLFGGKGSNWKEGSRIEEMNYVATKIIEREKGKNKFIVWMGRAHLTNVNVKQSMSSPSLTEMRKILIDIDSTCDWERIVEYSLNSIVKKAFNNKNYEILKYRFHKSKSEELKREMELFYMENYEITQQFIHTLVPKMNVVPSPKKILGLSVTIQCPSVTLTSKANAKWMLDRMKEDLDELCLNGKKMFRTLSYEESNLEFSEK